MRLTNALAVAAACLCCLLGGAAAKLGGCPFVAGSLGQLPVNDISLFPLATEASEPWKEPGMGPPSSCTDEEYEQIARDLIELAEQAANLPKLFRMGFHACATWSAAGRTGGCNGGWHKFAEDFDNGGNAGLKPLTLALKEYQASNATCITFADLVTLGGAVGAEAAGGPPVAWYPGRRDALGPGPVHPSFSARLPMGAFGSAGMFYYGLNLGLTNRELVALTGGGHSMGGADASATGWNGTFLATADAWPKDQQNAYFTTLVEQGWEAEVVEGTGRVQYVPKRGQAGVAYAAEDGTKVMRLPSDIGLRTAAVFSFWSYAYAKNESAFVRDFQRAMQRTLQLGAGDTYELDTSYQWKGLEGDWEGFGPDMAPQSDYTDIPIQGVDLNDLKSFYDQIEGPLADPGVALTLESIKGSAGASANARR